MYRFSSFLLYFKREIEHYKITFNLCFISSKYIQLNWYHFESLNQWRTNGYKRGTLLFSQVLCYKLIISLKYLQIQHNNCTILTSKRELTIYLNIFKNVFNLRYRILTCFLSTAVNCELETHRSYFNLTLLSKVRYLLMNFINVVDVHTRVSKCRIRM